MPEPESPSAEPSIGPGPSLHSASIRCDACARETTHRILHVDGRTRSSRPRTLSGIARCRECGLSHRFVSTAPRQAETWLIVSDGARSERRRITLPADRRLQVGSGVPESDEELVIHRLDDPQGRAAPTRRAWETATVWAVRSVGSTVPFSFIEGRITRSGRLPVSVDTLLEVGAPIRLPTTTAVIVGLRARNQTWRRPGDRFPAAEVQRLYARRTLRPPGGSNDWSSDRPTPRSRTSATSAAGRSRSSPGVRRARTFPRARTASAGATVQRS